MTEARGGGCLCGAVRFTAVPEKPEMSVCHCEMCRRWTSGVFMGVGVGKSLALEGEPALGVYASSPHGERVFCPTCGSSLFWRMRDGSHTEVAAQAFDDPSDLELTKEVFIDSKPPTYGFANETRKLTGAELMAMVTGGSGSNG
jgi:hypothetical protein